MPYPDLPPSDTFWRCPNCNNEQNFAASGIGHIRCLKCNQESTAEALKQAHTKAAPSPPPPQAPA